MAKIRGSVAVEFALVFPLVVLFLYGVMEVGRAYWVYHTLQEMAASATRYAMVHEKASIAVLTNVAESELIILDPNDVTISATRTTVGTVDFVEITATYDFTPVVNFVFISTITLTGRSRVPIIY